MLIIDIEYIKVVGQDPCFKIDTTSILLTW